MTDVRTEAQLKTISVLRRLGWAFNIQTIQKGTVRLYNENRLLTGKVLKTLVAEVFNDGRVRMSDEIEYEAPQCRY